MIARNSPVGLIIVLALVTGSVVIRLLRRYNIKPLLTGASDQATDTPDDSAILAYYTAGHLLDRLQRSAVSGMKYSIYMATPKIGDPAAFVTDSAAIMVFDLPFNTQTHLLGLSKQHKLDRIQFENFLRANGMEKVLLEGDFPDIFDIYAAKGQQFQVRYVLDPKAMAFVVDFCQSHFWEINSSELYIVATENDTGSSSIIEQSQEFVTAIKPALLPSDPSSPVVQHEAPYGEYDGPALDCPICSTAMVQHDNWHQCLNGHGILISGRDLVNLRDRSLQIPLINSQFAAHQSLLCPNCRNTMVRVDYEETGVYIDSCEHCIYRWVDANKIQKLVSKVN